MLMRSEKRNETCDGISGLGSVRRKSGFKKGGVERGMRLEGRMVNRGRSSLRKGNN